MVRYLYPTLTADALTFMVPAILLVALLLFGGHVILLRNWDFGVWIGPPEWIGALGALLALVALVGAAASLGVPSARQAPPAAVTDGGPSARQAPPAAMTDGGPPAPLQAAASRFAAGGVLGLVGLGMPVVLMLAGMTVDPFIIGFVLAGGGCLAAGTVGAYLAAAAARGRQPDAAHRVRFFGVLMLLIQLLSLYFGAWIAASDLHPDGAGNTLPAGALMLAVVVIGVAATLGGFAGLADPRSERFLQPRSGPARQGPEPWTATGPRPVDDPAPAEGYTVP